MLLSGAHTKKLISQGCNVQVVAEGSELASVAATAAGPCEESSPPATPAVSGGPPQTGASLADVETPVEPPSRPDLSAASSPTQNKSADSVP
jgi:hypothetical protein